jgi:hypothetical protein
LGDEAIYREQETLMNSGKFLAWLSVVLVGAAQIGCVECENTADCEAGEVCMDGQCTLPEGLDTEDTSTTDTGSGTEWTSDECQDMVDNDADGATDCDDPDCQSFDFCLGEGDGGADGDADGDTDISEGDYWTNNVCNGFGVPSSSDCKGLNFIGCCDWEGKYICCEDDHLVCANCPEMFLYCSWNYEENNWYTCMDENFGADPTGDNPMNCTDLIDAGVDTDSD